MKTEKINNIKVECTKIKKDNREIIGYDLFPEPFCNIGVIGKKKSGKTVVASEIVKRCHYKNTIVIIFAPTLDNDITYKHLLEYCEKNDIPTITHKSMYDEEGNNIIKDLEQDLEHEAQEERAKEKMMKKLSKMKNKAIYSGDDLIYFDPTTEKMVKEKDLYKKKEYNKIAPDYLIILDDMGQKLKDSALGEFIFIQRHFMTKLVLLTQYLVTIPKGSRKNIEYYLLFRDISEDQLYNFYKEFAFNVIFDKFLEMYKDATKEEFNFFYVSTTAIPDYRKNFDCKYIISDIDKNNATPIKID